MKLATLNAGLWPSSVFGSGGPLSAAFEDAFRHFAGTYADPAPPPPGRPAMNAWETDDEYHVEFAAPGVALEDIDVTVEGSTLKVTGTRSSEPDDGDSYHRRERFEGSFERAVDLALPVDAAGVTAELRSGILEVVLPKAEQARPRKIEVRKQP